METRVKVQRQVVCVTAKVDLESGRVQNYTVIQSLY